MVSASTTITNKTGLHARPASEFVKFVGQFTNTDIKIGKGDKRMNAKSILNLLTLGLNSGAEVDIYCEGENEQDVLDKVVDYLVNLKD